MTVKSIYIIYVQVDRYDALFSFLVDCLSLNDAYTSSVMSVLRSENLFFLFENWPIPRHDSLFATFPATL
jgi:hypothetical protein